MESWGLLPSFAARGGDLDLSRRLLPVAPPTPKRAMTRSDLPVRMGAGAAMVVFVTTTGPNFGPRSAAC